jgi:hypothetical protein
VAVEGVVVEADFGVEGDDFAGAGDDERVYFDDGAVEGREGLVHRVGELGEGADLLAGEGEAVGEAAGVVGGDAGGGVDSDA